MPWVNKVCPCGKPFRRRQFKGSKFEPTYCSIICMNALHRKYVFTEEHDNALRLACRQGHGAIKALCDTPLFTIAGLPYHTVLARTRALGILRSVPAGTWGEEESAYCEELFTRGLKIETIRKNMAKRGWHRSPSAIMFRMSHKHHLNRNGAFLTANQFAVAIGTELHAVSRWIRQGLLKVHHSSDMDHARYISYPEMKRFIVENPFKVAQGTPDVLWLIGMLTGTPHQGE
jgi:hypothetical protein